MKKSVLLILPLALVLPLILLLLGAGNANIDAAQAACGTRPDPIRSHTRQAGTGADLGVMPTSINATPGGPWTSPVLVANANIKTRSGFTPGIRVLTAPSPDFLTLNEVGDVPISQMRASAPGYDAYRDPIAVKAPDGGQRSLDNAIMWRADTWTMLDGGRVRITLEDHVIFQGHHKNWGRWAIWGVFQRTDGSVVAVIAVHQMTNPFRDPEAQWGDQPFTRAEQYAQGMDYLIQLASVLSAYGPVLVGGDMNTVPDDGPDAAAAKMQAAGYQFTKDSGVIYNFYASPMRADATWEVSKTAVHSDHPALFSRMSAEGTVPTTAVTETVPAPTGCPPCPLTGPEHGAVAASTTTRPDTDTNLAKVTVAAAAAAEAGFRGDDLLTAVAIAGIESGWDPTASNDSHFGLWQIAQTHRGIVPGWTAAGDIFDPLLNAKYAFALYQAMPGGSGEAKFADWLPFEHDDYHQYLDLARQAVVDADAVCASMQVGGELSRELVARIDAMLHTPQGLCQLSWTRAAPCTYDNQCPKVVDALYGGLGVGRGFGDGQDVAQGIIDAGLAQAHGTGLDPLPPDGAVVSYDTGDGTGHVAIYVGNGRIFGNDYGCIAIGIFGCVGFADVHAPGGAVTWALPERAFDLGGIPELRRSS